MKKEQAPTDLAIGDDLGIALRLQSILPELTAPPTVFERVESHVLRHKIEIPLAAVAMSAAGVAVGALLANHSHRVAAGH